MEYIPVILLYSLGLFLLGFQFGKSKYECILNEIEKTIDE